MEFLFWTIMAIVFWFTLSEWRIWWNVWKWKRQMKKEFDDEWSARQRSGSDEGTVG